MDELVEKLFSLLEKHKFMIATAESCTGGLIAATMTEVAGSSAYVERGFVTYSNEAKMTMLDVNPVTIKAFGAVSEQTARLMARGAHAHSNADITVSVTGVAGPGGGTVDKPVGTVFIGLATADHAEVHKHVFKGDRLVVRDQTVETALQYVIDYLETL